MELPPALLQLHILEGPVAGKTLVNDTSHCTIGRTKKSMFQIKDPSVSERHAELKWHDGRWEIRDVGSSNGTKVNATLLDENEWVPLNDGDSLLFGSVSLVRVEIAIAPAQPDITVEQYLEAEVQQLEQRIRTKAEQLIKGLRDEWQTAKRDLIPTTVN